MCFVFMYEEVKKTSVCVSLMGSRVKQAKHGPGPLLNVLGSYVGSTAKEDTLARKYLQCICISSLCGNSTC